MLQRRGDYRDAKACGDKVEPGRNVRHHVADTRLETCLATSSGEIAIPLERIAVWVAKENERLVRKGLSRNRTNLLLSEPMAAWQRDEHRLLIEDGDIDPLHFGIDWEKPGTDQITQPPSTRSCIA